VEGAAKVTLQRETAAGETVTVSLHVQDEV
jgi:hypothetical protein